MGRLSHLCAEAIGIVHVNIQWWWSSGGEHDTAEFRIDGDRGDAGRGAQPIRVSGGIGHIGQIRTGTYV